MGIWRLRDRGSGNSLRRDAGCLTGGGATFVPHAAENGPKVYDHSDRDEIGHQDHDHADRAVALVVVDDCFGEAERGVHAKARIAERCDQACGKQCPPADLAEQQDVRGPPPEKNVDNEQRSEDEHVMASGTDLLSDLDAQPEADQQPGHPDQAGTSGPSQSPDGGRWS
jgi:hypothetical protein